MGGFFLYNIRVEKAEVLKNKPNDNELKFGTLFTDHMFIMDYSVEKGWYDPRIVPYGPMAMDPSSMILHYGQGVFEGMKAYRRENGKIAMFRPKQHLNRMNISCQRLCIPEFDVDLAYQGLTELLKLEKDWVPHTHQTSLYIRPFIIATDPYIGVRASNTYRFFIILSPVGAYYPEGFKPVKIMVTDEYVRAVRGGIGHVKTAGNYAASILAAQKAKEAGYTQVLWLDGVEQKYIEEVGTMNIFFVIDNKVITPPLNGSILGGITRNSVLQITKKWGLEALESHISIDDLVEAAEKGTLQEIFGTGTAAVISPVNKLAWKDKVLVPGNGEVGELSQKLYNYISDIQYGITKDEFNWVEELDL